MLILNLNYILTRAAIGINDIRATYPYIISNAAYPISLLVIVTILSQGKLLPYALVGGLISALAMNGISLAAAVAPLKSDYMYKDMIVTTKTSPTDYMLGELTSQLVWSSPSIVLFFLLDIYFGLLTPFTFVMTLFIGLLVLLITSSISFWISSFVRHTFNVWAMSTLLSIILITISPTFYPYSYLPKGVLYVMEILPTTSAAVLEQGIFNLAPMSWYPLVILIIEVIGFFLVAKYLTKWRED